MYNVYETNAFCIGFIFDMEVIVMSEQVLIQFRADKNLKQEVSEIYESLGMDLPTAFRMFMSMSKMVKGIPFSVTIPEGAVTRTAALLRYLQQGIRGPSRRKFPRILSGSDRPAP